MDSLITAAAHALAAGDPLGALNRIALREDASALALRGIAMAQLGDFPRARALLKAATRAFGAKATLARSRCIVAEAEIALASRDLAWPAKALDHARATLEAHGDRVNAAHARYLDVRRALLIGRLDAADRMLAELDPDTLPATLRTAHELMSAGIAMRRLHTRTARAALERATHAAREARIPHWPPRSITHGASFTRPQRVSSRMEESAPFCSTKWKRCSHRMHSSWMRAVYACVKTARRSRSPHGPCFSRSRACSRRHGPAMRHAMR